MKIAIVKNKFCTLCLVMVAMALTVAGCHLESEKGDVTSGSANKWIEAGEEIIDRDIGIQVFDTSMDYAPVMSTDEAAMYAYGIAGNGDMRNIFQCDGIEIRDGSVYYIIRAYNNNLEHLAGIGWYALDIFNHELYDIATGDWELISEFPNAGFNKIDNPGISRTIEGKERPMSLSESTAMLSEVLELDNDERVACVGAVISGRQLYYVVNTYDGENGESPARSYAVDIFGYRIVMNDGYFTEEGDSIYELASATFKLRNTKSSKSDFDVEISCPKILYGGAKYKKINEVMKNDALGKCLGVLEVEPKIDKIDFQIAQKYAGVFSIIYNNFDSGKDSSMLFTSNINLSNNKIFGVNELYKIDENFVHTVLDEIKKKGSAPEMDYIVQENRAKLLSSFANADKADSDIYTYFTNDYIGIGLPSNGDAYRKVSFEIYKFFLESQ